MIIYKIENKINSKIYIGQTKGEIKDRLSGHILSSYPIGNALRKYGLQSFDISIIDTAISKEVLNEKEIYWIRFYNCKVPNGYNLADGGGGANGYKHSEEAKQRIGEKAIGRNVGRVCTEKTKNKLSETNKGLGFGRKLSEKTKRKISESHIGKKLSQSQIEKIALKKRGVPLKAQHKQKISDSLKINHPMKGKHFSEEVKLKLSESHKGQVPWNKNKIGIYSEETRKKMSESRKGKTPWNKGKFHSEESKKKMSELRIEYHKNKRKNNDA